MDIRRCIPMAAILLVAAAALACGPNVTTTAPQDSRASAAPSALASQATATVLPTPTPTPTPSPTPPPSPVVAANTDIAGTEPTVAVDPENGYIAVATQHVPWPKLCSRSSVVISRDGGKTWSAPVYPMGNGCQDIHAVVAWGPNHRLWFGDAFGTGSHQVKMSVSYTDDYGKSWAAFYTQAFTPAWVGCFPMMVVDNEPGSTSYGTVYVVYNWLAGSTGPGLHVMAKPLGGYWTAAEVPVVGLDGYPAHNRIGYRVMSISGGAVVAWYESDLRAFPSGDILSDGSSGNIGRAGFATADIAWGPGGKMVVGPSTWAGSVTSTTNLLRDPRWQYQLALDYAMTPGASDFDAQTTRWLAVSDGKGHVLVGSSVSGAPWTWAAVAAGFKPVIAIDVYEAQTDDPYSGVIFLGYHAGSPIRNYYTLSYDGGATWTAARQAGGAWNQPGVINGAGLRENAVYDKALGGFVWVWGNGAASTGTAFIRP